MITSAKPVKQENENEICYIKFLNINGTQVTEEPVLSDQNTYVSKIEHDKVGKIEVYNSNRVHYLKQYRGGRPGELLVDPYGMMAKSEDLSAFVTQRGRRFCEYVKVPEDIYNSYRSYLSTRDSRYFRACEKFILDQVI